MWLFFIKLFGSKSEAVGVVNCFDGLVEPSDIWLFFFVFGFWKSDELELELERERADFFRLLLELVCSDDELILLIFLFVVCDVG